MDPSEPQTDASEQSAKPISSMEIPTVAARAKAEATATPTTPQQLSRPPSQSGDGDSQNTQQAGQPLRPDSPRLQEQQPILSEQFSGGCLLYTSPSPRDGLLSRMPSSA